MCRNQRPESSRTDRPYFSYDIRQVVHIVRCYQELRSVVEFASTENEKVSGGGQRTGKEDLMCMLADIDRGTAQLSPRQTLIIGLLKRGYRYEDICRRLNVSISTVKFHTRQGIMRLTDYLNTPGHN